MLKQLVDRVNINCRDCFQWSPLHKAAMQNGSPYHHFGAERSVEVLEFLINNGAQINAKEMLAASLNPFGLDGVKYLVENGALLDAKDYKNKTPLERANEQGNLQIVKYLEEKMNPPPILVEEEKKISNQDLCIVCLEPRNGFYALNPCGHLSLCEDCCIKITNDTTPKCPTCRKAVITYLKLFNQAIE